MRSDRQWYSPAAVRAALVPQYVEERWSRCFCSFNGNIWSHVSPWCRVL